MLLTALLAVTTGTWVMLGVIAATLIVGLIALAGSGSEDGAPGDATVYVFGLGKHPRLVRLPEARDIPATPGPLGGDGLRSLASDAGAKTRFTTERYRLADGRWRPYELSEDLPRNITQLQLRAGDVNVWIDDDGTIHASRDLANDERGELESLFVDHVGEAAARADRRTWNAATHSAREANAQRT